MKQTLKIIVDEKSAIWTPDAEHLRFYVYSKCYLYMGCERNRHGWLSLANVVNELDGRVAGWPHDMRSKLMENMYAWTRDCDMHLRYNTKCDFTSAYVIVTIEVVPFAELLDVMN